jgi:protein-S-isoprenylcysteine O-methyltransferase Ste14
MQSLIPSFPNPAPPGYILVLLVSCYTPYLILATILFLILGIVLWKPLPIQLPLWLQLLISILGAVLFFSGLVLYIWGRRVLGESFNVSTGFGVRLTQAHRLVTNGPFAYVRHPMYIGVILACWGGLLLYRTWTMLFLSIVMLGLVVRARKEEQALAQVYGRQWELYQRHIPAWFPNLGEIFHRSAKKHPHGDQKPVTPPPPALGEFSSTPLLIFLLAFYTCSTDFSGRLALTPLACRPGWFRVIVV